MTGAATACTGFGWLTTHNESGPWGLPIWYGGGCPGGDYSWSCPVIAGSPAVTFQVRPNMNPPTCAVTLGNYASTDPNGCNGAVTQTSHLAGMTVGMGDGSVRSVSPTVSATTWRIVGNDPAYAGLTPGSDW
jgi:hypothetical protein